jgi:hypothetical protein
LTRWESRQARAALEAFAPSSTAGVDHVAVFERIRRASSRKAALGMRLAIWIVALAPLWVLGTVRTLVGIPLERRARLLGRLLSHRIYLVRELALLLKLNAAFALLGDPAVRSRSGFDGGRRRFALAVLEQPA